MNEVPCIDEGCDKPARMAVNTRKTSKSVLSSTVYWDNRQAPKSCKTHYCKAHGLDLLAGLVYHLVHVDA